LRRRRDDAALYRASFEHAPEAIFFYDADGRWTDTNPAACQMLGYTREELIGTRVVDLIPPERAAAYTDDEEALLAGGGSLTKEELLRRKDGTHVWIEVSRRLLPDGRGHMFARDVTARRKASRELEESLRWTRAVLEQCPVGMILVHGPSGENIEANSHAQQMFGRPLDGIPAFIRRLCPDGKSPLECHELPCRRALRGEHITGERVVVCRDDGTRVPIIVFAAPIVGDDGEVLGAIVAFEDVSAQNELERLRAEWSSVVAHDLRQPLGSILLHAQMLARSTDDPKLLRHAGRIDAAAGRLNRMVGDLMDLSRLEAQRLELALQRVDVPALVRGCVEQIALQAGDRTFDVHAHEHVPDAYADPDRIAQVVENLLTNAIKYGRTGSGVIATVAHDAGEVAVSVTNEGRSLSEEELRRIFERFQRTDSARLEGIQGVGLGLYITRSLVHAHGGRVSAESTAAGVNTFRFTLPVAV
jgi:PAS domain S-box-containing protein